MWTSERTRGREIQRLTKTRRRFCDKRSDEYLFGKHSLLARKSIIWDE